MKSIYLGLFIVDNNNKLQTYPISGQTIFLLTDIDFVHRPIPMFGFENAKKAFDYMWAATENKPKASGN